MELESTLVDVNQTTIDDLFDETPSKTPNAEDLLGSKNIETKEPAQKTEKIENAVVYLFGLFLHFLTTREKLYPYDYILCNDLTADGQRVRIGYFEYLQAYVGTTQPGMYFKILALAPSIKPEI